MTTLLTLTEAGNDTGPFNLYTDLDGFVVPFELGVLKSLLLSGYLTSLTPDYATVVRIKSEGGCVNYVDIPFVDINATTTTSTTLTTTTTIFVPELCYSYLAQGRVESPGLLSYTDCNDVLQTVTVGGAFPEEYAFNARLNSLLYDGTIVIFNNGAVIP
jgi:hypothetical protein